MKEINLGEGSGEKGTLVGFLSQNKMENEDNKEQLRHLIDRFGMGEFSITSFCSMGLGDLYYVSLLDLSSNKNFIAKSNMLKKM